MQNLLIIETQLWDKLTKEIQFSDNVFEFKKLISKLYKGYKESE